MFRWSKSAKSLPAMARAYSRREANIAGIKSDGTTLKWYKNASVDFIDGEYCVLLDDRVVKTPKKNLLALPSEPLAWSVAAEWELQEKHVRPSTMPMMTLATTALDVVPEKRSIVIPNLLNYLKTDVCCIRTPRETHPELRELQDKIHAPFCKWFSAKFNVPLLSGSAFGNFEQPQDTLETIQWHLFELDDFELSCFDTLTSSLKSLILPWALYHNMPMTEMDILEASRLEEDYQIAHYGEVEGAHDLDRLDARIKVASAGIFLRTLRRHKLTGDSTTF